MKRNIIVANWKSNKTESEAKIWLDGFNIGGQEFAGKEVIICPSFTLLPMVSSEVKSQKLGIKVGAQNISRFGGGAYTGEVSAKQVREFADFVIIGHSERRKNFAENEEIINEKIAQAIENKLTPIICVSSLEQAKAIKEVVENNFPFIVAYEPLFAIGTGVADTPENADKMATNIKNVLGRTPVLYGGSVISGNVNSFTSMSGIDGVLVGKASLDPLEFAEIIKNA